MLFGKSAFWIAEQYLEIPREIYPDRPSPEKWYSEIRSRWKEGEPLLTPAEFFAVKSACRHALSAEEVDVGFWLDILAEFEARTPDPHVVRKASYEVAVSSLRGGRTLHGHEDRLREYFRTIPELNDPEELEDAANLLQYTWGARRLGQVDIPPGELVQWRSQLGERANELLNIATTPARKALLLDILGHFSLVKVVDARHWFVSRVTATVRSRLTSR